MLNRINKELIELKNSKDFISSEEDGEYYKIYFYLNGPEGSVFDAADIVFKSCFPGARIPSKLLLSGLSPKFFTQIYALKVPFVLIL